MKFGERLKKIRKDKKMTKAEMAYFIGMSERMLSYYEKGDFDGEVSRTEKYESKLSQLESGNFHENSKVDEYLTPELKNLIRRAEENLSNEKKETIIKGDAADELLRSHKILADLVELGIKAGAIQWIGKVQISGLG